MIGESVREEITRLAMQGKFPAEISRHVGCSRYVARRVVRNLREAGVIQEGVFQDHKEPDEGANHLPTSDEIKAHCAVFLQRRRDEDRVPGWRPPCMAVGYVRGRATRHIDWRRDQDAEPAA